MKNLILGLFIFSALIACKKELEPQSTTIVAPPLVTENSNVPVTPVATPQTVQTAPNTSVQVAPQQVITQRVAAAPQKVPKGMNPPHGQPNHRCDIAVGAPLNSPIAKPQSATQVNGSATIIPVKSTVAPVSTPIQNPEAVAPATEKKTE